MVFLSIERPILITQDPVRLAVSVNDGISHGRSCRLRFFNILANNKNYITEAWELQPGDVLVGKALGQVPCVVT